MSYALKLLPIVYRELKEAKQWYNNQKVDLGTEFKIAIEKEIEHIRKFPRHYQIKYKNLRQSPIKRFPYSIFIY